MAESFRRHTPITHGITHRILTLLACLLLVLAHASDVHVHASPVSAPVSAPDLAAAHYQHWHALAKRVTPIVVTSQSGDNTSVINPATNQPIAQGPGTDGGGTDFSLTAIIWLAFVFVAGVPLALAGVRLYRVTTGLGVGIALTLAGECCFFFECRGWRGLLRSRLCTQIVRRTIPPEMQTHLSVYSGGVNGNLVTCTHIRRNQVGSLSLRALYKHTAQYL